MLEGPARFDPSLEVHISGSGDSSPDAGPQSQQEIKASDPNSRKNPRAPFPERFSQHGLNLPRKTRRRDRSVDKDSHEWAKDMRAQKEQTEANTSTPTHQQA